MAFAAGGLTFAAARHALAARWASSRDPEMWLRAAESEPTNADLWYRLARYRQFDFEHSDLPLAISYYRRAISINPGSASYWMDLAGAYETIGNASQAEQAFRKGRESYPISAEAAWRFGNFLLRQGRIQEAFRQMHDAVVSDPKLASLAVSRCWASDQDIDEILKTVLPDGPEENWGAIQFFVQARKPLPAMAVWRRLAVHQGGSPVSQSFPLLDLLIETGHTDDAQTVWARALAARGINAKTDSRPNSVFNGGFEQELLDGGFDWRVVPIEGAEMAWDEHVVHSGRRSLRVDFKGTANVDFQNIWQYAAVLPATRYRFGAFVRTEDLTTDKGIHFGVRDVSRPGNPTRFTPEMLGTQPWTEVSAEFTTGPDTTLLQLVLRRSPSDKLGNKIRGTAWVDDVVLAPVLPGAVVPQ